MGLIVTCDVLARCLTSWALRVPFKNAALYNTVDIAVTYFLFIQLAPKQLGSRIEPKVLQHAFRTGLIARTAGLFAGFLIAKAAGYRVGRLACVSLAVVSTVAIIGALRMSPKPRR